MKNIALLEKVAQQHFESDTELVWLKKKLELLQSNFKERSFYLAFSACSRFIRKGPIPFRPVEQQEIAANYPNFGATSWSREEIARILFMLALPTDRNQAILDKLFETADYGETMALYKGLYFLDNASDFVARAREGLRTNMTGVFDALALNNPFPYKYLPKEAWNHMVLKATFMGRPLYKIYKIEERKSKELALIFLDYAHERWSAHRKVSPELWRFISGYADEQFFPDIKRIILGEDQLEAYAATRALIESDYPKGKDWLKEQNISTAKLPDWQEIGQQLEKENQEV